MQLRYAPLAITAAFGLFSQGVVACGSNCGDGSCTVVDDAAQYTFDGDAASRAAGSASDCQAIYDGLPTGDGEFSDEDWSQGDCEFYYFHPIPQERN